MILKLVVDGYSQEVLPRYLRFPSKRYNDELSGFRRLKKKYYYLLTN